MKPALLVVALGAALALFVPMVADIYVYSVITTVLIWTMLGHAWNLLGGFTGQISFGHAMYLGIGAYASMIIVNAMNLDIALTLLLGGLLAGAFAVPVGLLIFRLQGPYFALGTLAVAEIFHIVARNMKSVTNGGEGMMLAKVPTFLGLRVSSKDEYFLLAVLLAVLVTLFVIFLMRSKTGYLFLAVRENQDSAEALGINSLAVKIRALFLSAFLAGLAGGFYGLYNKFIDPEMTLTVHMSAEMIFVTLIGGIGTVAGPIIGSGVLITLQELLRDVPVLQSFPSLYLIVYGLIIMLVVVYLPGGLVDIFSRLTARVLKGDRR